MDVTNYPNLISNAVEAMNEYLQSEECDTYVFPFLLNYPLGKRPYSSAFHSCTIRSLRIAAFPKVQRTRANHPSVSLGYPFHRLHHQFSGLLSQQQRHHPQRPSGSQRHLPQLPLHQHKRPSDRSLARLRSPAHDPAIPRPLARPRLSSTQPAGSLVPVHQDPAQSVVRAAATHRFPLDRRSLNGRFPRSQGSPQPASRAVLRQSARVAALLRLSRAAREAERVPCVSAPRRGVQRARIDGESAGGEQASRGCDHSRFEPGCRSHQSSSGAAHAGREGDEGEEGSAVFVWGGRACVRDDSARGPAFSADALLPARLPDAFESY